MWAYTEQFTFATNILFLFPQKRFLSIYFILHTWQSDLIFSFIHSSNNFFYLTIFNKLPNNSELNPFTFDIDYPNLIFVSRFLCSFCRLKGVYMNLLNLTRVWEEARGWKNFFWCVYIKKMRGKFFIFSSQLTTLGSHFFMVKIYSLRDNKFNGWIFFFVLLFYSLLIGSIIWSQLHRTWQPVTTLSC